MTAPTAVTGHDVLVLLRLRSHVPEHEARIHRDIASRIADFLDVPFDGTHDPQRHAGLRCYYVPDATLVGAAARSQFRIQGDADVFGGYAEHAFMPTKAITHGLVNASAQRPEGWSDAFIRSVAGATLPGYTAFSKQDLRLATRQLLEREKTVRMKPVLATAGRGQVIIRRLEDLDAALAGQDASCIARCGIVVEAHLEEVVTYSVGQFRLPGLTVSYIGTQCLTRDNAGEEVYGGSQLCFRRGGFDALLAGNLSEDHRQAVEMAARYDAAADACYPQFFASRRNYDVAAGTDARGQRQMGVLEQSWRIGGASRAETAAMEVFSAEPDCQWLRAETLELFGPHETAPPHAIETFSGEDPDLGLIRKYVMVEPYGNKQ